MGQIREDYVHHITVSSTRRTFNGGEQTDHYLLKGTSEQIAAQVAKSVKSQLDYGESNRIELTPIPPHSITDLTSGAFG